MPVAPKGEHLRWKPSLVMSTFSLAEWLRPSYRNYFFLFEANIVYVLKRRRLTHKGPRLCQVMAILAFWCERFWSALRNLRERGWRPVHWAAEAAQLTTMQISAPFCFGCGRHIERSFAGSEPHSIQLLLHCCVSEFWSHCRVLTELADSRLSFLRCMAESIDSHGAEQVEVGFHRNIRWLSLLFKLIDEATQRLGNAGRAAGSGSMRNGAI